MPMTFPRQSFPLLSLVALLCGVHTLPSIARAEGTTLKIAVLPPKGSAWFRVMQQMGEDFKSASGGKLEVRLYPGGVAGDDSDVVRKIRLGTLDGAVLSTSGLGAIDPAVSALQFPLMFDSYDDIYKALELIRPELEKVYAEKGFVVLNWVDAGWAYFFTKTPVKTPADLKALKLFAWQGDRSSVDLWKKAGFNPVSLPATEVSSALQTGLVTAMPTSPQAAVLFQWYNHAPNMTRMRWGLLVGATVISKKSWDKLPAEWRPKLLEAAAKAGQGIRDESAKTESTSIDEMKARGLNVVELDDAARSAWVSETEKMYPSLRGGYIPAELYDRMLKVREDLRAKKTAKAP